MVVDPHVHTRDFEESYKETVQHALLVARAAGVSGIFAMPNTKPALTERKYVEEYLALARDANVPEVAFGVYMGLTKDGEQVKRAVATYRDLFPKVVGFKLYAGHSTNNLGVIEMEDQQEVFGTLAREGYEGVVFVHAEKESRIRSHLFDRSTPISHVNARPQDAEIESIEDILAFSRGARFKGKLHIAHISTPKGVNLVTAAKTMGQDVSCGVTPHHLWYNYDLMDRKDGVNYKVNPPLRSTDAAAKMVEHFINGRIDWLETDHAPHLLGEKNSDACPSGISSLHAYPLFVEKLKRSGLTDGAIRQRTHEAITERFGIDIPFSRRATRYDGNAYEVRCWDLLKRELDGK